MRVLIDSDILIDIGRLRDARLVAQWNSLSQSDSLVLVSAVSVTELWAGVRPSEEKSLSDMLGSLRCVPIDADAARLAGDYLRAFRKSHGTDLPDAIIAASAILHRAKLWTRNRKHYPMKELTFH